MHVVVTGGAGFVGSHLARQLLEAGHHVTVVDNLATGRRGHVPAGAEFLELDVSRPESLGALPGGSFDAVCHLAAQSSGPASAEMPYHDLQANAASTLLLSRWCLERRVPRFLYASSMAIYGEAASPVREDAACAPLSYYGVSKLASEHLLRLAAREGLDVACFRMFSVYGPGQNLGNLTQGMVSIYLAYLLQGIEVPVTGSLQRVRDFLYIDDAVRAWRLALERPLRPGVSTWNLGSGRPVTVRALLDALLAAVQLPASHPIRELPGSAADQFALYADVTTARRDLGWQPSVSLPDGLEAMAAWAKSQAAEVVRP
ncbi:MAG: NAD-dependent epimerase/dehydratase family protein [Candidatus Omnitrophica bacterium]|nr:NAD-dependent epimerase/dehydratase family protein [Candidatus Omnitrophota bacterium]